MSIEIAKKEDYKQICEVISYCFNYGENFGEGKENSFHPEQYIVNKINGRITNSLRVIPYKMKFEGNYYDMGGIGGVASLPEDRSNGSIAKMLTYGIKLMNDNGYLFSALGPFSMQFYRHYGYEWAFSWQMVKVKTEDLKEFKGNYNYKSLNEKDEKIIEEVREQYIKNFNGPIYHDEEISKEFWKQFHGQFMHCYASYDENNNINAVAFYKISGHLLECKRIYFLNMEGFKAMLNFFYTHRSQVEHVEFTLPTDFNIRTILPTPRVEASIWPFMMARIINAEKVLNILIEKHPVKAFNLKVIDENASWNNQTFKLSSKCEISNEEADATITIQRLTQLALGQISGKEALNLEIIKIHNDKCKESIENLFLKHTTMLWQEF